MTLGDDDHWLRYDDECPDCHRQMTVETCETCDGEGWVDERSDDPGTGRECPECNGVGKWYVCDACGTISEMKR